MLITVTRAGTESDFAVARALFEEYAGALQIDLCFQHFSAELDNLAAMYGPPAGALLIAIANDHSIGCVGLRPFRDDICEMKRLYVRPAFRGQGLGRRLAAEAAQVVQQLGYREMVLDTLASMEAAHALYLSMGFQPADAYYPNPLPDVRYLALDLTRHAH